MLYQTRSQRNPSKPGTHSQNERRHGEFLVLDPRDFAPVARRLRGLELERISIECQADAHLRFAFGQCFGVL